MRGIKKREKKKPVSHKRFSSCKNFSTTYLFYQCGMCQGNDLSSKYIFEIIISGYRNKYLRTINSLVGHFYYVQDVTM